MIRLGPLTRTAVFLLGMAVFSGACSSDSDPLTVEEYFSEFEAIDADVASLTGQLVDVHRRRRVAEGAGHAGLAV